MGEGGGAVGRGHGRFGESTDLAGAAVGNVALHQVEAADDAGEHVVEVMGDAAGKLADRFHFLRMAQGVFGTFALEHLVLQALVGFGQLAGAGGNPFFKGFVEVTQGFFGLFTLGFIDHEDVETVHGAIRAVAWQVIHQGLADAAVAVWRADAETAGPAGQRFLDVRSAQRIGFFAEHFKNGSPVKLLRRQPVPVEVRRIVQAKAFFAVDVADQDRHGVDDQLQLGLALAQGLFGVFALGQVQGGAEEADRPAVMVLVAATAGKHPAHLAVGLQQAIFLGVFGAVGDAMLDAAGDQGAVFGVYAVQVFTDRQLTGHGRVDAMQLGKMRIGDEAVLADVPVPGTDRIGGGEGQLQAFLGFTLGLEAGRRALFEFEGDAPAFVGFDGGDQDPGHLGTFVADRAVGQVEPEVRLPAPALQGKALLAVGSYLTLQDGAVDRVGKVFQLWPDQVCRLSESLRMLACGEQGEAVVVDLCQLRAP
ncbi:hypothetical protein D3C76_570020 [compost metagenome]